MAILAHLVSSMRRVMNPEVDRYMYKASGHVNIISDRFPHGFETESDWLETEDDAYEEFVAQYDTHPTMMSRLVVWRNEIEVVWDRSKS